MTLTNLSQLIDHSLLQPTLTDDEVRAGVALARRLACAAVCVKPYSVPLATDALRGSSVAVCAVAGFPHGNSHRELKQAEAERAIAEGASEIDVVVNVGKVLGGDWSYVSDEVKALNDACVTRGALLKVIFENDYLENEHIVRLCELCTEHRVAFAKTSTGYGFVKQPSGDFNYRGAREDQFRLMREHSGPNVQLKASGGIRTLDDFLKFRALGASRIGTSATEAILTEAVVRGRPGV